VSRVCDGNRGMEREVRGRMMPSRETGSKEKGHREPVTSENFDRFLGERAAAACSCRVVDLSDLYFDHQIPEKFVFESSVQFSRVLRVGILFVRQAFLRGSTILLCFPFFNAI